MKKWCFNYYHFHQNENGFKSLEHLRSEMKKWCIRYNNVRVMSVHKYKTPTAVERELLEQLHREHGQTVYLDLAPKNSNNEKPKLIEKQATIQFIPQNTNWAFATRPLADISEIA